MGRNAIVAGTGFANSDGSNRAYIIHKHCRDGMPVRLVREPNNQYDKDAIAVYISVPRLFGLLGQSFVQIGYIKASAADNLAKKMDSGTTISASVASYYAPEGRDHPRVSLKLEY